MPSGGGILWKKLSKYHGRWWPQPNMKDHLCRYWDFHYEDKTVVRQSYLYNGNSYIGTMSSLYWNRPLDLCIARSSGTIVLTSYDKVVDSRWTMSFLAGYIPCQLSTPIGIVEALCGWMSSTGEKQQYFRYENYQQINSFSFYPLNSSPPSAAYMCQWIGSALVQIMAWSLFGAKPLSKPMLRYCQLDT